MALGVKTHGLGELSDGFRQRPLETRCGCHIDHLSTLHTMKMVMVLGEILGKLKPSEIVVGGHAPDETYGL